MVSTELTKSRSIHDDCNTNDPDRQIVVYKWAWSHCCWATKLCQLTYWSSISSCRCFVASGVSSELYQFSQWDIERGDAVGAISYQQLKYTAWSHNSGSLRYPRKSNSGVISVNRSRATHTDFPGHTQTLTHPSSNSSTEEWKRTLGTARQISNRIKERK